MRRTLWGGKATLAVAFSAALLAGCAHLHAPAPASQPVAAPSTSFQRPELDPAKTLTRIAFASCLEQSRAFKASDAILAARPDLLIMMGDNVYGDSSTAELNELRGAYAALDARLDWGRLRSAIPMLATWDDHDYGLNDAGAEFPHKDGAKALFASFWGIAASSPMMARPGIYDSVITGSEGRRVQVILLDTRTFRSPLKPTDKKDEPGKERYMPDSDPSKQLLGQEQWAWLERELKKPADVRLLVSSIQVIADGHGWERWGNLPKERERLFALIRKTKANGIVILSGDRHSAAIYRDDGAMGYPVYEFTSSSLNLAFPNSKFKDLPTPTRITEQFRDENFGMLAIDWSARTVTAEIKDNTGKAVLSQTFPIPR